MKNQPILVALVQQPPVFLNLADSMRKAISLIEEASREDANVIVFPETWLPGYPVWIDSAPEAAQWDSAGSKALHRLLLENSMGIPGPELDQLLYAGLKHHIHIIMGAHERIGNSLYNIMLLLDTDGKSFVLRRKLVPTHGERLVWGRGDGSTLGALQTDFGPVGGLICWEHWMPAARAAMHAHHEVLHIAQWPGVHELHDLASRHYAFEGQCFVAAAGTVLTRQNVLEGFHSLRRTEPEAWDILQSIPGDDATVLYNGGSSLIAPDSSYIIEPCFGKPAVLYGEIEPGQVLEGLQRLDVDGHYSRPDVFSFNIDKSKKDNIQ